MRALQRISAFTVNLSYNLEPVYGVLLAFLFLKENRNLHSGFYAGLGCILFSIIAQMLRLWRKRERPLLKA
jgi:drug/metabolite transporter (DMT)-like permease